MRVATIAAVVTFIAEAVVVARRQPVMWPDSAMYLRVAAEIAQGHYFGLHQLVRPPGYPWFLYVLLHVAKLSISQVVACQLLLLLASCCIGALAVPRTKLSVVWYWALVIMTPTLIVYSARIMTEALTIVLVTGSAYLLSRRISLGHMCFAGIGLGLAILCRPPLLLLPLGIALFTLIIPALPLRHRMINAAAMLVTVGVVLLPYTLYNRREAGTFTPVPPGSAAGGSLYLSMWQEVLPLDDLNAVYFQRLSPAAEQAGLGAELRAINAEIGAEPLTAPWNIEDYPEGPMRLKAARVLRAAAWRRIKANPLIYTRHVVLNVWKLWNTSYYPARVPPPAVLLLRVASGLATVFGLAGAAWLVCTRDLKHGWFAMMVLYFTAVHSFFHTEARYTAAARVALFVCASFVAARCYERLFRYASQASAAAGKDQESLAGGAATGN